MTTALAQHPPGSAGTPEAADPALPALMAGAVAGTHRAAVRELRRRIMSGERPEHARDAVASAALQAFDLLCSGLHATSAATEHTS
ncbi:hypothetical protein [Streptomyces gibsoniae]|uniref:Uncharacterized protein n=1 Tax=Streptomyces gibsoniae TaxID=3075529 RepID=A0ABU2TXH2_9ACTN|nr:hypothetical protein [Streptomyces sp. DSM 41699]MDT0465665.1 hypothetical protein [Streptomyces sp. DSM 41699]